VGAIEAHPTDGKTIVFAEGVLLALTDIRRLLGQW
jgi:hypothetical protein